MWCRVRVVLGDRPERVEADDELDRAIATPRGRVRRADSVGQVQTGSRRGHGSGLRGVDRLVAIGIGERSGDVRRQRHLAEAGEMSQRVVRTEHLDVIVSPFSSVQTATTSCHRPQGAARHLQLAAPGGPTPPTRGAARPAGSSSSTSTAAPLSLCRRRRAGITRESLSTRRSSGRAVRAGRSRAGAPACSTPGRRAAAPRRAARSASARSARWQVVVEIVKLHGSEKATAGLCHHSRHDRAPTEQVDVDGGRSRCTSGPRRPAGPGAAADPGDLRRRSLHPGGRRAARERATWSARRTCSGASPRVGPRARREGLNASIG